MDHAVVVLIGAAGQRLDVIRHLLDARTIVVVAPTIELARRWLTEARPAQAADRGQGTIRLGELQIDRSAHRARWRGRRLALSEQEFQILVALAEEPGRARSFRELLTGVWRLDAHGDPSLVRAAVRRLRGKLASAGVDLRIEAVRGVGFRLDV